MTDKRPSELAMEQADAILKERRRLEAQRDKFTMKRNATYTSQVRRGVASLVKAGEIERARTLTMDELRNIGCKVKTEDVKLTDSELAQCEALSPSIAAMFGKDRTP